MKEVLTKGFWRDVKKTFQDALDGPPAGDHTSQAPADGNPQITSTSETSSSVSATSEQH
jgi:hypothetical protein